MPSFVMIPSETILRIPVACTWTFGSQRASRYPTPGVTVIDTTQDHFDENVIEKVNSQRLHPTLQSGMSNSANSGFFSSLSFIIFFILGIASRAPALSFLEFKTNRALFSCSISLRYRRKCVSSSLNFCRSSGVYAGLAVSGEMSRAASSRAETSVVVAWYLSVILVLQKGSVIHVLERM